MNLELCLGIGIIAIGAFASGSFTIPFGKVKEWKWENNWLVYCLFAYVCVPVLSCVLLCPNFIDLLIGYSFKQQLLIFSLGVVYGICNITFGLSLKYLGISLGFMISLGLMMVLGTIVPPAIDGRLDVLLGQDGGNTLIIGLLIGILGVALSAYAGYRKDKATQESASELNFGKGILLALFVGATGASQALGIEQGNELGALAAGSGIDPLFQMLPVFLILFMGSFCITLVWCLIVAYKNQTLHLFTQTKQVSVWKNYLYCALAGFLWFINMIFFGMGKKFMGQFSFTAFGILMSLTIVAATLWGLYRREWKVADVQTRSWMYAGLIVLIVASFVIGISGQ